MPKDITQPVNTPGGQNKQRNVNHQPNEPLSGSKKVKQANHTRHNNGEG